MTIVDKKASAQEVPAQKAAGQNVAPSPKAQKGQKAPAQKAPAPKASGKKAWEHEAILNRIRCFLTCWQIKINKWFTLFYIEASVDNPLWYTLTELHWDIVIWWLRSDFLDIN